MKEQSESQSGLSLRQAGKIGIGMAATGLVCLVALFAFEGCSSTPTKFDDALFTRTNVPMVVQHNITNVVNVTNWAEVPIEVIRTNSVTITNVQNEVQVIPVTVTNWVSVQTPTVTQETNVIAAGSTVMVPQLTGPKAGTQTATDAVSAVAGLFGWGGLVTTLLGGLTAGYMKSRNATLAAAATGATAGQQVMQQAAVGLTENIETLLNVLQQTPQGAQVLPIVKQYLVQHQAAAGTIQTVATLLGNLDEPAAKDSAGSILNALAQLQGRNTATANQVKTGI